MNLFKLLRNASYNRPFLLHPRILAFDSRFATHKDVINEILSVLDIESAAKNHKIVKQGIEQLNLAMRSLEINDKQKLIPVFVKYGKWFSGLRQVEGSLECYNSVLEIFKGQPDAFEEERIVVTLSQISELLKLKNFKQCEKLLDDLKETCDKIPENIIKGKYLETTGKVKILVGKKDEALNFFERAKTLFLQLETDSETQFHLIISTNYLSMLYSVKGDENFYENFYLATKYFLEFQENDNERLVQCLEVWTRNINFVEHEEKFFEFFDAVENKLESNSADLKLFFYENVIESSENLQKNLGFIGSVFERLLIFVEREFSGDLKLKDRVSYMCALKMMADGNLEKTIEYAKKCLEIRKLFRDIEMTIVVKNLLVRAYIENKEILAAKLMIKELDSVFKRLQNPQIEEQHRENIMILTKVMKRY